MGDLFSYNSRFYHFMSKVADCMILSVLWVVFSLPVFTAGAATTALYYCVVKVIREDRGTPLKEFLHAFKSNFKQSTIISLITFVISVLETLIGSGVYAQIQTGESLTNIYFVYLVLLAFCIAWLHYIYSYIARFQAPLKTIIKNSLVICIANLPNSLSMMVLFVVVIALLILTMPASAMTLLLVPSVYVLVVSFMLEKIYKKYLPADPLPATVELE